MHCNSQMHNHSPCSSTLISVANTPCSIEFQSAIKMGVDVLSIDGFECLYRAESLYFALRHRFRRWSPWRRRHRRPCSGKLPPMLSSCVPIDRILLAACTSCSGCQDPLHCVRRNRGWSWPRRGACSRSGGKSMELNPDDFANPAQGVNMGK